MFKRGKIVFLALLVTAGCATVPSGPGVMVMPGSGKSFEEFRADDVACRQWAEQQLGISPQERANQNVATGALAGTAIGAGLGAAIGSVSGSAGAGAAIGAGTGLLVGAASGANAGQVSGWEAQRRYDIAYQQCMFAKGNQIPGARRRVPRESPPPPPGEEPDNSRY